MERVYLSQMLSKRQTDIERRLRLDRVNIYVVLLIVTIIGNLF